VNRGVEKFCWFVISLVSVVGLLLSFSADHIYLGVPFAILAVGSLHMLLSCFK